MTIAERIRLTRQQKRFSQKELSERSGVNIKSLSRYELGTSMPPANSLKALADALGVSADHLLDDQQVSISDKDLLKKFEAIQNLQGESRAIVDRFLDLVIRDQTAKQAYAS